MHFHTLSIFALSLFALFPLAAQPPAAKKTPAKKTPAPATPTSSLPQLDPAPVQGPFPIHSFKVKGSQQFKPEQVIAATGLTVGQKVDKAELEAAMQRLVDCGYFERAGYRYEPGPEGIDVTWEVVEIKELFPYAFEEFPIKADEAKKILAKDNPLFSDRVPATKEFLRRYMAAFNSMLKLEGDFAIGARLTTDDKGNFYIRFRPNRPRPAIYSVDFRGNKLIPGEELRAAANSSAGGIPFSEPDFREILDLRIRPMYEARGRMNVVFLKVAAVPLKDNDLALNVIVDVQEGDEYKLKEIRYSGPGAQLHNWDQIASFRTDEVVNMAEIEEGRKKMEQTIRRDGFLQTQITQKNIPNHDRKLVDVEFHVEIGPAFTFDTLEIKGLDLISEPALRKIWNLKKGAAFNPEYPDFFLKQIREDGIFDNLGETKAVATPDYTKHTVSVLLTFKGEDPEKKKREAEQRRRRGLPPQ